MPEEKRVSVALEIRGSRINQILLSHQNTDSTEDSTEQLNHLKTKKNKSLNYNKICHVSMMFTMMAKVPE